MGLDFPKRSCVPIAKAKCIRSLHKMRCNMHVCDYKYQ